MWLRARKCQRNKWPVRRVRYTLAWDTSRTRPLEPSWILRRDFTPVRELVQEQGAYLHLKAMSSPCKKRVGFFRTLRFLQACARASANEDGHPGNRLARFPSCLLKVRTRSLLVGFHSVPATRPYACARATATESGDAGFRCASSASCPSTSLKDEAWPGGPIQSRTDVLRMGLSPATSWTKKKLLRRPWPPDTAAGVGGSRSGAGPRRSGGSCRGRWSWRPPSLALGGRGVAAARACRALSPSSRGRA